MEGLTDVMTAAQHAMQHLDREPRPASCPGEVQHGARVAQVQAEGVPGLVVYQLDAAEHERRVRAGLGAVPRLDLLDALMGLPLGEPVPATSLTAAEQYELRRLPPGYIGRAGHALVRLLAVPLRLQMALVEDSAWRRGLVRAGAYTGTTRVLVLTRRPPDLDDAAIQADYWGIALMVSDGPAAVPEVVVEPRPFRPRAHTAAMWLFCEQIYRQAEVTPRAAVRSARQTTPAAGAEPGRPPGCPPSCRTRRG